MVRLIFALYATGDYSTHKIENELYARGYRGRNGTRIHHNSISGMLQNPKYKGYYCGNKVKVVDHRTKEQRFLPESEWIMYKDETGETVPAIVDEEIWDKCNEIFKERSRAIKTRERSFKDKSVFTGKIWCKAHERPYWRTSYSNSVSKGEPIYQWICSEKKRFGADHCASISILERDLYRLLGEHFQSIAGNIKEYVRDFLKIYRESDQTANTEHVLNDLRTTLSKEKAKRDKLLDIFTEDLISKEEFKERNATSNVLISQLEEDIASIEKKAAEDVDYAKELGKIEKYFLTMYSSDHEMTKDEVDEMVKAIIDRIDVIPVTDGEMRLEIKLKTGIIGDITYIRHGDRYSRRSGHMMKKMIDSYKMQ